MWRQRLRTAPLRWLVTSAIIVLAVFGITGLVCWVIGARSLHGFGSGLVWGGIVVVVIGAMSMSSAQTSIGDRDYQTSRAIHSTDASTAYKNDRDYLDGRVISFVRTLVVGIAIIALGELLRNLSR